MRNKVLKMLISTLLLITLTSANFILLGVTSVTYAVEKLTQESETNHKNISFMAYFKEGENKEAEHRVKSDISEETIYLQIAVKQEGYFNGKVTLTDSNFKFKTDTKHERIQSITEKEIQLNQIVSGETIEIPVGVEIIRDTNIDVSLLTAESKLKLEGEYTYGSRPDTKSIKGERTVQLKITSPYEEGKEGIFLNQEVLTNKVFQYKGESRRIIQLEVETGMEGNLYPIKTEKLELQAPKLKSKYPIEILVETPDNLAMNGEKIEENNYKYNEETGILNIEVNNEEKDGKVVWNKTGADKYIVTYIFGGTEEIEQQDLSAKGEISLYDPNKTVAKYTRRTTLSSKEIDSSITVSLNNTENEIYKGAIYEGIEREIAQNINVNVNLIGNMDTIKVEEDLSNTHMSNIRTKAITVNKGNLVEILGEEGRITIKNKGTGAVIGTIVKSEENEEITVELPAETGEILIETTKPVKAGILTIKSTKVIPAQDRQAMQGIADMTFGVRTSYTLGEAESEGVEATSVVALKETQSYATLELSRTEFSTMRTNENVEMRITLHSNNEKYELYKNPHVRLTLPEEFEEIEITSINLLNETELEIVKPTITGNVLDIPLQGEQTGYKGIAIEGATILITANLTANRKQKNVETKFILEYENEKGMHYAEGGERGRQEVGVQIVSYAGIIATNTISEYGIDTVNNDGNNKGKLELGAEGKEAEAKAQVINNYEAGITGVKILGKFPTEKAIEGNNIKIAVKGIQTSGIENSKVKIYYTENGNATEEINNPTNNWKENIVEGTEVKKYIIVVDRLEASEEIDFTYSMSIPEKLEYNKTAEEEYEVIYNTEVLTGQIMKAQKVTLETGVGPVLTPVLEAYIGGEKSNAVKEGQIIEYRMIAKNEGSIKVENFNMKATVPDGTVYTYEFYRAPLEDPESEETAEIGFIEDPNKKEIIFEGITLEPGQELTETYFVKVKKGTASQTIKNALEINFGQINKVSEVVETSVEQGKVEISVASSTDNLESIVESRKSYRFIVRITNITDKDLKNVKIKLDMENATTERIIDLSKEFDIGTNEGENIYTIETLEANKTHEIVVTAKVNAFNDAEQKDVSVLATATIDKEEYKSNKKIKTAIAPLISITNVPQNESQYVKAGEEVTYKIDITNKGNRKIDSFELRDVISNEEELRKIQIGDKELSQEDYETRLDIESQCNYIEIQETIEPKQTKTCLVTTQIGYLDNSNAIEITNVAGAYIDALNIDESKVTLIVEPVNSNGPEQGEPTTPEKPGNTENPENPEENNGQSGNGESGNGQNENGQSGNGTGVQTATKLISGYAWLDKNENGQRDSDEALLDGITVRLFNTQTNEFQKNSKRELIQTTTSSTGMYTLSEVPQGNYMVVFEFNNSKYALTTYEKSGISSEKNSKVISREMTIDGVEKTVAVSEAIEVKDNHISYINMGLKERKVYDMKLEKMITRVIVQNAKGTETTQFQDTTLAKVDIHAKQLSSSNVVVDYKIRVTNEGETEGYIKNIVDYVSPDFKFSSELNKDWYQSGANIYNSSLANTKLQPGESKEVTLTLTKQMTENNTGTITNTAEIVESYNEQGLKDADSVEGNRAKGEDDMSQADLIVSISTGEIVVTVTVIISIIAVLALVSFAIIKKVMKPVEI